MTALLILATLLAIAVVVVLIAWLKINPFVALILGSAVLVGVSGMNPQDGVTSFAKGVGDTFGSVGILVALGAIVGRLLVDSGGAGTIVERIVSRVSTKALPWAMAGAAVLVGLPMFFEIGLVLLIPIILMVARRSKLPMLAVAIPALAGLSVLHGLVPPHPGPLTAIGLLHADLGLTLLYGIIVALPTVVLAGPLWGRFAAKWGPQSPPENSVMFSAEDERAAAGGGSGGGGGTATATATRTDTGTATDPTTRTDIGTRPGAAPSFLVTLTVVLLPVVLMLARAVAEIISTKGNPVHDALFLLGTPLIALLIGTLAAMVLLGLRTGMGWGGLAVSVDKSLPPMAGTLLIIAAGGGFKQTLVDAGVGNLVADWAKGVNFNVLILGWLVAVGIRLATGSATVATITSAGIVGPLAAEQSSSEVALLVLALGCGSLFFSHVNDVGFWLVKQYFGMTVKQTILTWSLMETIISVAGLVFVLILSTIVT